MSRDRDSTYRREFDASGNSLTHRLTEETHIMSNTDHQVFQDQVNDLLLQARVELGLVEAEKLLPPRMWYPVIVYQASGAWGLGHVVTRLSLEEWARVHKVKVTLQGYSRRALHEETTDLL